MAAICFVAEREGFEPSIQFPVCRLSKAVPSASRPPLPIEDAFVLFAHVTIRFSTFQGARQRRRRDSNPRDFHPAVFKTAALNRSATPPTRKRMVSLASQVRVVKRISAYCQGVCTMV